MRQVYAVRDKVSGLYAVNDYSGSLAVGKLSKARLWFLRGCAANEAAIKNINLKQYSHANGPRWDFEVVPFNLVEV